MAADFLQKNGLERTALQRKVIAPPGCPLALALDHIRQSPKNQGLLEMIVRRPGIGTREVLEEAELDLIEGLVGDSWIRRGSSRSSDKAKPHPEMQLNVMNTRTLAAVAGDRSRWPLAGDQLLVDFDLSGENLPPGTQLALPTDRGPFQKGEVYTQPEDAEVTRPRIPEILEP